MLLGQILGCDRLLKHEGQQKCSLKHSGYLGFRYHQFSRLYSSKDHCWLYNSGNNTKFIKALKQCLPRKTCLKSFYFVDRSKICFVKNIP